MKHLSSIWILIVLLFFIRLSEAKCQSTNGSLAVRNFAESTPGKALKELQFSKQDTAGITLLLKISSIYWRGRSGTNSYQDSCVFFARKALKLSSSLHFTEGQNEANFLICKALIENNDLRAVNEILRQVTGEQHVRLLLVIGEHYSFLSTGQPANLNNAIPYIKQAITESESIKSRHWLAMSQDLMAKNYFLKGDNKNGIQQFFQIINDYHTIGDKKNEANYWNELALYLPATEANYPLKIKSFKQTINLYKEIGDQKNAGYTLLDMGDYVFPHNLDSAINIYLQTIKVFRASGEKNLSHVYLSLSEAYDDQGNPTDALTYSLLALKNEEELHNNSYLPITDVLLGNIYNELEEYKQSTFYYKAALDITVANTKYNYIVVKNYTDGLVRLNRPKEGIAFINKYEKIRPPNGTAEEAIKASALANCYKGLGDNKRAEQYYLQMITFIETDKKNRKNQIFLSDELGDPEAYFEVGKFYSDIKNFSRASEFLEKAAAYTGSTAALKKDIAYLQFRSDSASGDYLKAISHYAKSAFYKDSIYRATRIKELTRMRVAFETTQKEKDLELLQKEGIIQKKEIEHARQTRLFTYTGLAGLVLLLIILYNRYRLKQKSNLQLQQQKNIIDSKNASLTLLLQEKEWLLKEVHHRVKNNLQIITSLLNSQSKYLNDEVALNAITESQHRVRAMSMIHQKLYAVDNKTTIYMSDYLQELISYLKESFNTGNQILFYIDVSPIAIDLNYAVSVGLIVNEAITNAIKYAFPYAGDNKISVHLKNIDGNKTICLSIIDNGTGLPVDYNIDQSASFGMVLIKGMVEDLNGELQIYNDGGTKIIVTFEAL